MKSKKIRQLNKSPVHQIKTITKRNYTNKTKKRERRLTQKAGSRNEDDSLDEKDDIKMPTQGPEAESLAIADAG